MQFSALKTEVENRTGSHTRTGDFINAGQLELAKEAQNVEKADITFTSGVASVPATCLVVVNIMWDGYPLITKGSDMYINNDTSDPTEYTIKNGQIVLNTLISETQTKGLVYIPRPAGMSLDADISELPDSDNALIAYARYMIYADLEYKEKADFWLSQWQIELAKWLKGHQKQNPRPRRTKVHGYY